MNELICSIEHKIISEICTSYAMDAMTAKEAVQYICGVNDMAAAISKEVGKNE